MKQRLVNVIHLGCLSYLPALQIQNNVARQHLDHLAGRSSMPGQNTLLLLEHNPVYTIGIRTKGYTKKDEERLKLLGAEFQKTNRGGLITFHGPGQLVVYPVINMKDFGLGMKKYVGQLERTVIATCSQYGVDACTTSDTGVWVNDRKICAIGIHGRRFITTHGIALNCNNDLSWFDHIIPCGLEGKGVTSLTHETGRNIGTKDAAQCFLTHFSKEFNCDLHECNNDISQRLLASVV